MVVDLTGKLPSGSRFIRITTNLKIYWDRIRVDNSARNIPFKVTEIPFASAKLDFRGYPRVVEGNPINDLRYIYEQVSATGPYTRQIGNYTRYGDVTDLVRKIDEKYVIYGSADEVSIDFEPANLPESPRRLDPRLFLLRRRLRQRHGLLRRPRRHGRPVAFAHARPLPISPRPGIPRRQRPPRLSPRLQYPPSLRPSRRLLPLPVSRACEKMTAHLTPCFASLAAACLIGASQHDNFQIS